MARCTSGPAIPRCATAETTWACLPRPRRTRCSSATMAISTGCGAFGLVFRRTIKTSPIKLGFRMAGSFTTKIQLTGFRRATHGRPAVLFRDCWLIHALLLGASCILFQATALGILGMGLWGGSARAQGQTLALTTTFAGLSLGSAPATVTLTPLPELAPAQRAAQNRAAPVIPRDGGGQRAAGSSTPHKCLRGQAGRDPQDLDKRSALCRIYRDCPQ